MVSTGLKNGVHFSGLGEQRFDTVEGVGRSGVGGVDDEGLIDVKCEAIAAGTQVQGKSLGRGGSAMLDGQSESVAFAGTAKVEVTISPCVEL